MTYPDFSMNGDALRGLMSSNPVANAAAAWIAAKPKIHPSTDISVVVYDKFYKQLGEIGDYLHLTVEFVRNNIDTATIVIKHDDPVVPYVMENYRTVVPIIITCGYERWSGRVDTAEYALKDGKYTVTLQCKSDFEWLSKIMTWPNFLAPIQVQEPKRAVFIGPAVTCIKTMIAEQAFRLQSGLWEFVNNAGSLDLDWRSWFGTILESDGNPIDMLMTPIVVVPTNPLFDTSQWISLSGRMDKMSTLIEQAVKSNGLLVQVVVWMPGDPQPAGLIIPLHKPTIVVDVKDMSGLTGPTSTLIDGLLFTGVDIQNSIFGDVFSPFLNPGNAYAPDGVNIAPLLGVNFNQPWVMFNDHPRSGIREFKLTSHSPLAHTIIGGGKSPQWVNDLINETLEFLIDAIQIAIGWSGIPSNLLDGTFDDVILAFQQIENFSRRSALGPYAYPEYFQQTGASAYTLDEWFALQAAMWDTRGFNAVQLAYDNGYPYTLGEDIFLGALASFYCRGRLYTDYIEKATLVDDREDRAKLTVTLGDGKSHENPIIKVQRRLQSFQDFVQIVTLSS